MSDANYLYFAFSRWNWDYVLGFFVDVSLFDEKIRASPVSYQSDAPYKNSIEDDVLADEAEHLMLKLKFLTYKVIHCF